MGVTIREIAAIAGVSPATVSLVLNDKKGVSEEKRIQIKRLLEEMNYSPQPRIPSPKNSIHLIKYNKNDISNSEESQGFPASIIESIESECRRYNIKLNISNCNAETIVETIKEIVANPLDGIIILGYSTNNDNVTKLLQQINTPIINLNNLLVLKNMDNVWLNNLELATMATKYLYSLGHRRIGHLHGSVFDSNFEERKIGLHNTLEKLQLQVQETILLDSTLNGAYMDMKRYLKQGGKVPPAVFADNDIIAIGAIKAMKEAGIRIPQDVSVIGIDDISLSRIISPSLTTIRLSRSVIGILVVDILQKRILHPDWPNIHIQISGELVERESTSKPTK